MPGLTWRRFSSNIAAETKSCISCLSSQAAYWSLAVRLCIAQSFPQSGSLSSWHRCCHLASSQNDRPNDLKTNPRLWIRITIRTINGKDHNPSQREISDSSGLGNLPSEARGGKSKHHMKSSGTAGCGTDNDECCWATRGKLNAKL